MDTPVDSNPPAESAGTEPPSKLAAESLSEPALEASRFDDAGGAVTPWRAAGVLLLLLACVLPPILIDLETRDSTHTMENVALVTSQETWLRAKAGDADAWLLPTNDSFNRVEKPPFLVWVNFLAWAGLEADASPRTLIHRARLMTVAASMLTLLAVFWIGCSLADVRMAVIATVMAGTNVYFQAQARTASYDMHFVTWATLSIASALWAMRPKHHGDGGALRPGRWALSGLLLGVAWMTKGPLALPVVLAPLVVFVVTIGRPWRGNLVGVLIVAAVAMIVALPWYTYAWQVHDDSVRTWTNEFSQSWKEPQPPYYYLAVLGLIAPWIVWLIGGLMFPWTRAGRGESGSSRRRALIPWLWFVVVFVLFTIPGPKQRRYILPILPACALLAGQLWRHRAPAGSDRHARTRIRIHWGLLLFAAIVLGPFLALQDEFVAWEWLEEAPFAALGWPIAGGLTLCLLYLTARGLRWQCEGRVVRSAFVGGVWMMLASTAMWHTYAGSATAVHPVRHEAERVLAEIGDAPMRALRMPTTTFHSKLNEEFRLYFGRLMPHVSPDELRDYARAADGPVYVLARAKGNRDKVMRRAGFEPVMDVNADKRSVRRLWKWAPSPSP